MLTIIVFMIIHNLGHTKNAEIYTGSKSHGETTVQYAQYEKDSKQESIELHEKGEQNRQIPSGKLPYSWTITHL